MNPPPGDLASLPGLQASPTPRTEASEKTRPGPVLLGFTLPEEYSRKVQLTCWSVPWGYGGTGAHTDTWGAGEGTPSEEFGFLSLCTHPTVSGKNSHSGARTWVLIPASAPSMAWPQVILVPEPQSLYLLNGMWKYVRHFRRDSVSVSSLLPYSILLPRPCLTSLGTANWS